MTSLYLPPILASISANMCRGSSNLLTILIPATVRSIGTLAFYLCSKLHTVTFGPDSKLTSMEDGPFYDCAALARIELPRI
jgi:hypothetical protein